MREQLIQYVNLLFAGASDCEDIHQEILQNTLDRYDDLIAQGKVPEAAYRLAITGIGDINEILGTHSLNTPATPTHVPYPDEQGDTPGKKLLRTIAVALYIMCPIPLILLGSSGNDMLEIFGVCSLLAIVAVATVLIMLGAKKDQSGKEKNKKEARSPLAKSIGGLIWAIGLGVYFLISFSTNAWHITWVIFPILAVLDDLAAILVQRKESGAEPMNLQAAPVRKLLSSILWTVGLAVYFILSFSTGAWYITWLVFPITAAVKGLVFAVLDVKEAMEYET